MASLQVIHINDRGVRASREINLSRPATLAEAISHKGLDDKHQVSLLRRRARRAERQDRTKVFASTPTDKLTGWGYPANHTPALDLYVLRNTVSTADYVSAWTRLNHLKEAA